MNEMRMSEDIYVDELWMNFIENNFSYVKALFPRIYVDVNRHPLELDQKMFSSLIPSLNFKDNSKVSLRSGVIPRLSVYGNEIYNTLLTRTNIRKRLLDHYFPYHKILKRYVKEAKTVHKEILIFDCHSMPSRGLFDKDIDIVMGTNYSKAISKKLFTSIKDVFLNEKFKVAVNTPYSGGYISKYYGNPKNKINVLQIEINRKKYMNEKLLSKNIIKMKDISSRFESIIYKVNEMF